MAFCFYYGDKSEYKHLRYNNNNKMMSCRQPTKYVKYVC